MPRPGPRPYECVRRAWHSDRHQPMRGSIISQIFRVVTEAHSSTTRKNREWQEKLPTVVIRAEEIMYSKANSEVEYMDPDTLWDRLNDAIDTIIRKEETVETGEYLQPCIEAALVLGCVPVKASRSERLSNPRSYLPHRAQEPAPRPSALSEKPVIDRQPIHHTPISPSNRLCIAKPAIQSSTAVNNVPRLRHNIVHNMMPTLAVEPTMNTGSVYPLYYASKEHQNLGSQIGIHMRQNQNTGNVIVGTPIGWSSSAQPPHICTRELFPSVVGACNSDKPSQDNQADARVMGCDLSLRLGRNFDPPEHGGDPRSSLSSSQNPRIGFLPRQSSDDHHIEPCSSRWATFEGEVLRKRKVPFSHDADEGSISQQLQRRPSQFTWKDSLHECQTCNLPLPNQPKHTRGLKKVGALALNKEGII